MDPKYPLLLPSLTFAHITLFSSLVKFLLRRKMLFSAMHVPKKELDIEWNYLKKVFPIPCVHPVHRRMQTEIHLHAPLATGYIVLTNIYNIQYIIPLLLNCITALVVKNTFCTFQLLGDVAISNLPFPERILIKYLVLGFFVPSSSSTDLSG